MTEQDGGVLSRSKERRVFLFEQIVIFSELLRKGSSTPGYQFKKSIKVPILQYQYYITPVQEVYQGTNTAITVLYEYTPGYQFKKSIKVPILQ